MQGFINSTEGDQGVFGQGASGDETYSSVSLKCPHCKGPLRSRCVCCVVSDCLTAPGARGAQRGAVKPRR